MITAKAFLATKVDNYGQGKLLTFGADYADGRNKDWAAATPYLNMAMAVTDEVADKFDTGGRYTLTFTPSED